MSGTDLFALNPALNRTALAAHFGRERRLQVRDVLTSESAREIHAVLTAETPWGLSWQADKDGPHHLRRGALTQMNQAQAADMARRIAAAAGAADYAFAYSAYPMVDAYLQRWQPGGPHDLLLEHLNAPETLGFIREVTGMPDLVKADGQATLYAPGQFLGIHDDLGGGAEGRRVAYVLNLTAHDWRPEWGGYLQFFDEEGDVVAGFRPRFNVLNLFAVPQKHCVTYVPPFAPVGRYAITGWFRDR